MGFLTSLTRDQVGAFIDVSIMGDGWERFTTVNSTKLSRFFGQNVGPRLDSFLAACALAGVATSTHVLAPQENRHGDRPHASVTLVTNDFAQPCQRPRRAPTTVAHQGVVWCPTMPTHATWLARRYGSVFFTGTDQHFSPPPGARPWPSRKAY